MVLLGRIELPTSALPRMRSTTELQQHTIPPLPGARKAAPDRGALLAVLLGFVKRVALALSSDWLDSGDRLPMRETSLSPAQLREQRLAAKLRENLQRRKAQARENEAALALPKGEETS